MKLGQTTKKILFIQFILSVVCFTFLFFTNGPIFMISCILIWFNILLLPLVFYFDYLVHKSKEKRKKDKKQKTTIKKTKTYDSFYLVCIMLVFLILLLSMMSFPLLFSSSVMKWNAESNKTEVQKEVDDVVSKCKNDEEKTIALLKWFDRYSGNIFNIWGHPKLGSLIFGDGDPYYCISCIRINSREPPLWVYTSRCGACEEHSVFFREMATMAGLKTRSVICQGIDHLWTEVYINDTWVIVEPANVVLRDNKTGYNLTAESFEKKHASRTKNISYVFAEYSNGTIEDITYRYSGDLSNVNISVVDQNLNPISNAKVTVFSNNRFIRQGTGLSFETDEYGKYSLKIGRGNVTLETVKDEGNDYLYNESTHNFIDEESYYDLTIVLMSNWTKDNQLILYLSAILLILSILVIMFIYTYKKERRK